MTEADEGRLLDHASPVVFAGIILAIDTGLRRDELFGLRWPQVDLLRGTITTTMRIKSGRARKVRLPARSAQILAHLPRSISSDFVFINPDTGTGYLQLNKGFKAAMRRAGITDLRWHDLRRTAGCRWLQRDGKSMEEVSILLGHSSVRGGRGVAATRHRNSARHPDSEGAAMTCAIRQADAAMSLIRSSALGTAIGAGQTRRCESEVCSSSECNL